jgi:hypothetical protein
MQNLGEMLAETPTPVTLNEPRKEPNFSYRLLRAIYPAFRMLFPNQVIRADDLARAMVDLAVRRTGSVEDWFSRTVTSGPWPSRLIPVRGDPGNENRSQRLLEY